MSHTLAAILRHRAIAVSSLAFVLAVVPLHAQTMRVPAFAAKSDKKGKLTVNLNKTQPHTKHYASKTTTTTTPPVPMALLNKENTTSVTVGDSTVTTVSKKIMNADRTFSLIETKTVTSKQSCLFLPTSRCMGASDKRYDNINAFFETEGNYTFIGQVKSIYNGASSSATLSADIGSLNLPIGTQVTIGTNIQAGATGVTSVATGVVPTLSAASAAQATQNQLYGGTITASMLYPLFYWGHNSDGRGGTTISIDLLGREGVDIQNFKANTSTTATSPSSHTAVQLEGYIQENSINWLKGSTTQYAGSVFIGGSYGYSRNSHDYARDYGFGDIVNYGVGQVSAGILLGGVGKLAISRAFGPSQTYIDSTTNTTKTVNNFKAWSFGINYQSAPPK